MTSILVGLASGVILMLLAGMALEKMWSTATGNMWLLLPGFFLTFAVYVASVLVVIVNLFRVTAMYLQS